MTNKIDEAKDRTCYHGTTYELWVQVLLILRTGHIVTIHSIGLIYVEIIQGYGIISATI